MAPTEFSATLSPDSLMVYLSTRLNGLDDQINTIFNTEKQRDAVQSALRNVTAAVSELDENAGANTAIDAQKLQDIQKALDELKEVDPQLEATIEDKLKKDGISLNGDAQPATGDGGAVPPEDPNPPNPTTGNGSPTGADGDISGHLPNDDGTSGAGNNQDPPNPTSSGAASPSAVGSGTFSGTAVKTAKADLDGITKDIESASQMDMIHLQSLMSSRQTAIQLATNMISALGESSKAIAANIGR
jgi:hypothetical protein